MLPVIRALALIALAAAPGCGGRERTIAVRATPCGPLCDGRAAGDFSGLDCAVAARLRVYYAPSFEPSPREGAHLYDQHPLAEACADLTTTPLASLFADSGGGGGSPASLLSGLDPTLGQVLLEVALYAPGGAAVCPATAGAPWLALGRSAPFDLGDPQVISVEVPLGCDAACPAKSGLTLDARRLEDDSPIAPGPSPQLGVIFPYESLESTAGACDVQAPGPPRGEVREFAAAEQPPGSGKLVGPWLVQSSSFAGCTVVEVGSAPAEYGCLGRIGLAAATYWRLDPSHQGAVAALFQPGAANGPLVIRVRDRNGALAAGARVFFDPDGVNREALYADDDLGGFSKSAVGATGLAAFPAAPTGLFRARFLDGTTADLSAGAPDDPQSITTAAIEP